MLTHPEVIRRAGKLLWYACALLLLPGLLLIWSGHGIPTARAAEPVEQRLLEDRSLYKSASFQDPNEKAGVDQTRNQTIQLIEGAEVRASQSCSGVGSALEVAEANIARYGKGKGSITRCVFRLFFDSPVGAMKLSLDRLKFIDTYKPPYFTNIIGDSSPFIQHTVSVYATTSDDASLGDPTAAWAAGELVGSFETSTIDQAGRTLVELDGAALARITSGQKTGGTLYLIFRGFEELSRLNGRAIFDDDTKQTIIDDAVKVAFYPGNHLASIESVASTKCEVLAYNGGFQPTQGVFQDDPSFKDMPGKRLVKVDDKTYRAELPMVKGRLTLLVGNKDSRPLITLRGVTNCTKEVAAGFKFTLIQGGETVLYEGVKHFLLPLDGPPGAGGAFEVSINAAEGIPGLEGKPFKFARAGAYELKQEIVRADGQATDIAITVSGEVVVTKPPAIHLQPVTLQAGQDAAALERYRDALAEALKLRVPDYFPVASERVLVGTWRHKDLSQVRAKANEKAKAMAKLQLKPEVARREFIGAFLARIFDTRSKLGDGGRWVILMTGRDYSLLGLSAQNVAGAFGNKIIVVDTAALGLPPAVDSAIAHELIHTMPAGWAEAGMKNECGLNYHDLQLRVANGLQITEALREKRRLIENAESTMGALTTATRWIDQCTYAHVLNELKNPRDPAVILVSGIVARNGPRVAGEILSMYQTMGVVDLSLGTGGNWAVVLRDAAGAELGRFPFTPDWQLPTHPPVERSVLAISYRVPAVPGVNRVELIGPGGLLHAMTYSANAPTVAVTSPAEGSRVDPTAEGKVRVEWMGSDKDKDSLLYTVLYSSDGGASWSAQEFEQPEGRLDVAIDLAAWQHKVKVLVTDGARSSEAVVTFRTGEPPQPPSQIAFHSERDGNWEIYVMNADGSGVTRLTDNAAFEGEPTWSPDGRSIAFESERDGNGEIYVMNADGSGVTRLTDNLVDDWSPSWSPDGRSIAFASFRDGNGEIYVMNADGSGVTRLTDNLVNDWSPSWSPDGTKIAFHSYRDGNGEIYVMNADGTGQTRLTDNAASDQRPTWSPDGQRIAFQSDRDGNYWEMEIYVMNADGTGQTRLTDNAAFEGGPTWSPDGRSIAFESERDGNGEIYVMNADGSGVTRLTDNRVNDWSPSWSR